MRRSLFQPCEKTITSVMPRARTSARKASRCALSGSPSASKVSSQNGSPAISVAMGVLLLYGLQGPHQVEQALPLEVRAAPERGRGVDEDLLDLVGVADELPAHRQQGGGRAGDVRCGHAGAGG